jgi:xanthine dehydrogenase accessory factor
MLDFRIIIIDERPEFANKDRFPEADQTIAGSLSTIMPGIQINGSSYIVILTRGHKGDAEALEQTINSPAAYIGMIGSKRKIKVIFDYLKSKGLTQEKLDFVHSPIGLPIDAETPEEIAVSIMAEIIKVRHLKLKENDAGFCR